MNYENDFPKHAASVLRARLEELGCSIYRFVRYDSDIASPYTMQRFLRGEGGTTLRTFAHMCDNMGLEIIIKPKDDGIDYKQKLAR